MILLQIERRDDARAPSKGQKWRCISVVRPSIGVGKVMNLPALRTVQAVLPHTALQALVSSSGVSRVLVGCA